MVNSPSFSAKSEEQKNLIRSILTNDITLVQGPAGSGKTTLSVQTMLNLLSEKTIRKIVVIRLVADTFDEHVGALPGELDLKMSCFLGPILDALYQIRTPAQVNRLIETKQLEALPVSHVRGRSFIDTGVIVDEIQGLSPAMVLACLTRIGDRSKMVLCGDPAQNDFSHKRNSGTEYAEQILKDIPGAGVVTFSEENIVRHPIIKHIVRRHKEISSSY
jgi:phosphate starvation-inducible PhoH-like protein